MTRKDTLDSNDIASEFDCGCLEAETNSKVWDFLFTSPFCCCNHSFSTSGAESSWDEDSTVVSLASTRRYSAEQTAFQAVWYLTGEEFRVSCSKSEESTQCKSSLRLQRNDACSNDLITEMYESCRLVYFPTKAIETESNNRSCLN